MSIRNMLFTVAFAIASLTAARAEGLRPMEGKSIHLGERYLGSLTTLSSAMGFTSSPLLRRARQERRSVSYLFLHLASGWFSQHRNKLTRSRSAGKATAYSFARRALPRTELRLEPVRPLSGM